MTDFNGFKGAAVRLDDIDIPRIASEIGCGEDEVHAFMEAETRGSGFDAQRRPRILFERHKFYLHCPKDKLAAAVKAGLANKSAGGYGKEAEQYGKLRRAMAIDEHSALLSCSWASPRSWASTTSWPATTASKT
nr:N-acetylmuramidase domain-containing protein [Neorhizobium tomejilense]